MAIIPPIDISNTSADDLMKMADAAFQANGNLLTVHVNRPISQYLLTLYKDDLPSEPIFFDAQLLNQCLNNVTPKVVDVQYYSFKNVDGIPCYLSIDLLHAWKESKKTLKNFGYQKIPCLAHVQTDTELAPMKIMSKGYLSSEDLKYSLIHKIKTIAYNCIPN